MYRTPASIVMRQGSSVVPPCASPLMKLPQRPMHWPISRPSAAMSHRPANDSFLKRL